MICVALGAALLVGAGLVHCELGAAQAGETLEDRIPLLAVPIGPQGSLALGQQACGVQRQGSSPIGLGRTCWLLPAKSRD